jgi:uncharacterized protein (TIGR01370 family)
MPVISSYALQYSGVNFTTIQNSTFDLFITEGAPLAPGGGFPAITDTQVGTLVAQGRTVVGYVNVAVTDDARYYWNPAWTNNGHDTGTPDGDAPSWLQGATPINFDGIPGQDALIVKFWEQGWKDIVIAQAVNLVSRGYSGVFLDDVGRYYTLGEPGGVPGIRAMANLMCQFIAEIEAAITQVNPNAFVVVNSDPYLHTNVTTDATGAAAAAAYLAAVDAHLLENQQATALDYAQSSLAGELKLILESDGAPAYNYADSWARGILYTASNGYNSLGTFAYPATSGADTLSGGDGPNQIDGLGGNDAISGGAGIDTLRGGTGNDTLYVDNAADAVIEAVGEGNDRVAASVSYALAAGSEIETLEAVNLGATNAMNLTGNEFANTIVGNNGVNILSGAGGNDVLAGGGGDDFLVGGSGNDVMEGGAGNDTYYAEDGGDVIVEGVGQGNDRVAALVSYTLAAGTEIETLEAITLAATNAMNLTGNALNNTVIGNNGVNTLTGGGGNDILVGAGGNDVLIGGASASAMYGGPGNDTYYVSDASDAVIEAAGEGADRIAASVSYALAATSHVEIIEAVNSAATTAFDFTGSTIGNSLIGNAGANVLDGKGGDDVLLGLGGADTFRFSTTPGTGNIDVIQDFVHGTDKIALDDAVFTMLAPGALAAGAFVVGSAAADADDRIVYNSATGQLFYDADGNGAGSMVQFASLVGTPTLTASDFTVI